MKKQKKIYHKEDLNETDELGSWTKEMLKPENLDPRIFHSTEELMKSLWDDED